MKGSKRKRRYNGAYEQRGEASIMTSGQMRQLSRDTHTHRHRHKHSGRLKTKMAHIRDRRTHKSQTGPKATSSRLIINSVCLCVCACVSVCAPFDRRKKSKGKHNKITEKERCEHGSQQVQGKLHAVGQLDT